MQTTLRQAIARIDIMQGDRSAGHGTGCLVAPDLVLTAMHVVANRQASPPALLAGTIVLTFPTHQCEATVVEGRWDPRSDWALLRCATPPPGVRPVPLADSVSDGEEWETFGFPEANSRDGLAQLGTVENANGTFETVAAYQLFSRQAAAGVGAPVKGLSGGPVIVDGALVGVFRSSLMREGQFNVAGTLYACPVETILARCADLLPIPDPCRGLPGLPRQSLPPAPYRFLERFTARDAEIFFGRNREIRDLYDRVTANDSASIVLLYGQSGAGKSSFLDAGLLPRLASSHAPLYVRRDRSKGLLRTLIDAMAQAFPATLASDSWAVAWLKIEASTSRPLVVILDQVEEAFTLPSADANEVANLVEAVRTLVTNVPRPQGRLILGFRKEWLGEIQKPLDQHGLDYSKVFLEALDAEAVTEVATGLTHTRRLRDKYGLSVEDGLAGAVAGDLTADRDSPVAPTLQVLLSRMWGEATKASTGSPAFTADLYSRITREGVLLTDFLDHQLVALAESARAAGGSVADLVDSGLALDVLRFHVSRLGTAEERSRQQLIDEYHRDADVAWLVGELKRLYLLTEPAGDGADTGATRLAHDTLAPAVRTRCDESLLPGQRARRLLEGRAGEWSDGKIGTPLDWRDLMRVEQGATGMRALKPDEERMVEASRAVRRQDTARRRTLKIAAAAAVLIVLGASVAAWVYRQQNLIERAWSDLLRLSGSIPVVLGRLPPLGLALAIDVTDRSFQLDRRVPAGLQEGLALALESAVERESFSRPFPSTASAFGLDGRIAAGTTSGTIHLYQPGARQPVTNIATGKEPVGAVSFSDDGEYLAAALGAEGVGIWRRDGQKVSALPAVLTGFAQSVKFVPGGHRLVAMTGPLAGPHELHLFDLDSADLRSTSITGTRLESGHRPLAIARQNYIDAIGAVLDRPGAHWLMVATEVDDMVHLVSIRGNEWGEVRRLSDVRSARFMNISGLALASDDGGHLMVAVTSREGLTVVDVDGRDEQLTVAPPEASFNSVHFGVGARTLVTGADDGLIRIYDRTGRALRPPFPVGTKVAGLAVSADGSRAVAGSDSLTLLRLFDLAGVSVEAPAGVGWDRAAHGLPDTPYRRAPMAFMPNGHLVAIGPERATRTWELDLASGPSAVKGLAVATLTSDATSSEVAVDKAGRAIAIIGPDFGLRLFHGDGSPAGTPVQTDAPTAVALSPDGRTYVTGTFDRTFTVGEVASGKTVKQFPDTRGQPIDVLAFDTTGDRFVAGLRDGCARIYRLDGALAGEHCSGPGSVSAVMFSPNGSLILGTSAGDVEFRNVEANRQDWAIRAFNGAPVTAFALHPSGSTLFVAGPLGLRVLDINSGTMLNLPMSQTTTPLTGVTVSPDGRLLVGSKAGYGFLFWRAGWQEWLAAGCDRLRQHPLLVEGGNRPVSIPTLADSVLIEPFRAVAVCDGLRRP